MRLPALKSPDEKVRTEAGEAIVSASKRFGFSQEELKQAADPRILEMAYYAQLYLKGQEKAVKNNENVEDREQKVKTKVSTAKRTLRPRGTSVASLATAKEKKVKVFKSRAKKTGRVEDVAAFLTAQRQPK